jgi:hypothetical protein
MSSSPTEILLPNQPADAPRLAVLTDGEHLSLWVAPAAVPDPGDTRGRRYPLVRMLAVAIWAVPAGACTFAAIADRLRDPDRPAWGRLGSTERVPAATTVWRPPVRIHAEVLQGGVDPVAAGAGGAGDRGRAAVAAGDRRRRGRGWQAPLIEWSVFTSPMTSG